MAIQRVFLNQPLRVICDTGDATISSATKQIRYKSPAGVIRLKSATIDPDDSTGESIYCDFAGSELNEVGKWEFRAYITFSGATAVTPGAPAFFEIEAI